MIFFNMIMLICFYSFVNLYFIQVITMINANTIVSLPTCLANHMSVIYIAWSQNIELNF